MPFEAATGCPLLDSTRQLNASWPSTRLARRSGSTADEKAIMEKRRHQHEGDRPDIGDGRARSEPPVSLAACTRPSARRRR